MNSHRLEEDSRVREEIIVRTNKSSSTHRSSSVRMKDAANRFKRPETPHINLFAAKGGEVEDEIQVRNIRKGNDSENLIKNFSSFMKGIIETKNENFLSGDTKVIEFIMTKYLNMDWEDIKQLEKLSIKINSDFGLLNQFGEQLQNLRELKLNNSVIISVSEVGPSFRNLVILNLTNCGLKDLSGIICYSNLEVLEAADNSIIDLIELEMCSSINKLNLKNNIIQDEENIQFLGGLTDLKWLNLTGNPIYKNERYEELIKENLFSLEVLDKEEEIINNAENESINEDKRFFESQSTFSSSPSFSSQVNNNRPVSSYTGTNFFNFNQKLKVSEELIQSDEANDHDINQIMARTNKDFHPPRIQTAKLKLNNINKNSPETKHTPWNLPDNRIFNFTLHSETARGKSQNPLNKNDFSQTTTGFNKNSFFNPQTLRPVLVKKDKPIEIKSFKKSVDEELTHEIIKNLDKNHQSKAFKLNPFDTLSSTSRGNANLLKNLIPNKEVKPLKLKMVNKPLHPIKKEDQK